MPRIEQGRPVAKPCKKDEQNNRQTSQDADERSRNNQTQPQCAAAHSALLRPGTKHVVAVLTQDRRQAVAIVVSTIELGLGLELGEQ